MSDLSLSQVLTIPGTQPVALDNTLQKQSQGSLATQVTLEALLIPKPSSTIIFPVRDCYANHLGINQGDMLIVDRDAAPYDGQLVIVSVDEEFIISRYDKHLICASYSLSEYPQTQAIMPSVWGTVTYVISKQA